MRKLLPAAALALVASSASAQPNLGVAENFNAFLFNNATTQVQDGNFDKILWNDNSASSFTINNRIFEGSLLAPNATVTQRNVIEGNLIAASLNDNGGNELHFGFGRQFDGTLLSNSASSSTATPEPGVVGLMAAGLFSGSLLLRRRKKA